MTDQTMDQDVGEDVEIEAAPRKGGPSGKKIVLFGILPLLLLIGAGAGVYLSGALDSLLGGGKAEESTAEEKQSVFYDMPTLLVNLNSGGRQSNYLKLSVSLEVEGEAARQRLDQVKPRIVDNFQVYLRELRIEDLQGSAGLQRLREELLLRVNATVDDVKVRDVLFKEMLVQ
ncbi:flagellar basal body-associated FliL family protein [Ferruginivarius sediminum]|uniref:Flagellar protein FliL n=1 Tax=Ferruginivarius sediminum TaxID=2661937 RepID=A0A369TDX7_9PROT|nr:flagellar basal body-associated FliL family protein [Ferruginivarius sediminum]RDD62575.1 flagellar basal body protein FliL [Ferruginivarius sediminum]